MGSVSTIDLGPWFAGTADGKAAVVAQLDAALQSVGFFLVTGHGVSRADRTAVRSAAREFFALPPEVKRRYAPDGDWEDVPYDPDAFTINTGDLLARWTGDRWISNRHCVLPVQAEAPDEDLVSLVYFYEANWDSVVESLQPPVGKANDYLPVTAAEFIKKRYDAITVA